MNGLSARSRHCKTAAASQSLRSRSLGGLFRYAGREQFAPINGKTTMTSPTRNSGVILTLDKS